MPSQALSMTLLSRVSDGMPLAASMEDEKDHRELDGLKSQAKRIVKQLTASSPSKVSIDSGSSFFHYINSGGVCYLCLTDRGYPKRLAFNYLEELQREFVNKYEHEVSSVSRPYAFIKFDTFIQKTKKLYIDTRTQRNLNKVRLRLRIACASPACGVCSHLVRLTRAARVLACLCSTAQRGAPRRAGHHEAEYSGRAWPWREARLCRGEIVLTARRVGQVRQGRTLPEYAGHAAQVRPARICAAARHCRHLVALLAMRRGWGVARVGSEASARHGRGTKWQWPSCVQCVGL